MPTTHALRSTVRMYSQQLGTALHSRTALTKRIVLYKRTVAVHLYSLALDPHSPLVSGTIWITRPGQMER